MARIRVLVGSLVGFAVLTACLTAIFILFAWQNFESGGPLRQSIFFDVSRGENIGSVAASLKQSGAISSELVFLFGAAWKRLDSRLMYGTYELAAGSSMADILDLLTTPQASAYRNVVVLRASAREARFEFWINQPGGKRELLAEVMAGETWPSEISSTLKNSESVAYRVTIAEGLTSWQVVQALQSAFFLEFDVVSTPAEGSLAPQTYAVQPDSKASDVLASMQEAQTEILETEWLARSQAAPVKSRQDALILASIIEKETAVASERGLIASVFANRLAKGMKLQADPTVIYGLTEGRSNLDRSLLRRDLELESPYNTYIFVGLPPTPICNPGAASIQKALNPEESDYLYFVADGSGGHAFARTYSEHRENVRQWRKVSN